MASNTNSAFPQTNASLQVHSLDTVESILSQVKTVSTANHEQFLKIFQAIEAALRTQDQCFSDQEQELNNLRTTSSGLQAQVVDLNAYIVQLTRNSTETHTKERKKGLIADPEIFKGDKKETKENQELFLTFTAQVELKMTGDKHCFGSEKEQIIYVASRISGPAYKNIKSWVLPVVEDKEGGFSKWQDILEVLRRVYGVADKRAAAEREMASLQQKNLPFVQFLAQFNTLLADLSWDSSARVSSLKAKINYELSQALVSIVATPEYNDYDGWVQLLVKLAENAEAHAQRKRPNLSHNNHLQQNHAQYNTPHTDSADPMQLDAARLLPTERMRRLQNNLCLYCGKPGHFKNECMEAAKATASRGRGRGPPAYRGTPSYRGTYQGTPREGLQYNRAVNWEQASVTPESSMSRSTTPIPTPSESTVGDLKDQSSV